MDPQSLLREYARRAPELLAMILLVWMFLNHLEFVAERTILAVDRNSDAILNLARSFNEAQLPRMNRVPEGSRR